VLPALVEARVGSRKSDGPPTDPVESARSAGLRYVTDAAPGITREMGPLGFVYRAADRTVIEDQDTLARIRALAVPPAWTNVWICPSPRGHLQASGRDARGRKQYRYHAKWRKVRDETKYDRMIAFGRALPAIRARTESDLGAPGLSREKVLATVVQLLEKTLIRVGNDEYAKANRSYGLTTMRDRHVAVNGSTVRFEFRGKSGRSHVIDVRNQRLARIVRRCRDLPGYELFQYVDADGTRQVIDSSDVNDYLREITGEDFTAKDFRTWAGTVLAARALQIFQPFSSETEGKRNLGQAVEAVAGVLGNTKSVCRKCYIHPVIIEAYLDRSLTGALEGAVAGAKDAGDLRRDLRHDEEAVLDFLERRAKAEQRGAAA
jgi:DNA topoisomerase-1